MRQRAPLLAAIGMVVVVLAAVFFVVMPKRQEVGKTEDQLEQAKLEQSALEAELLRLQQAQEEAPRLRAELARFERLVPPVADLPGLIDELQTAADVAGVDFFSISPGTPVPAGGGTATDIPAQVQVIGGFFPVDEFMFRLETLPRASKVVSLALAEGPDGLPQLDVQMEVHFFTTDLQAGPGAPPPAVGAEPEASPSPGESPAATTEESPATTEESPVTTETTGG